MDGVNLKKRLLLGKEMKNVCSIARINDKYLAIADINIYNLRYLFIVLTFFDIILLRN